MLDRERRINAGTRKAADKTMVNPGLHWIAEVDHLRQDGYATSVVVRNQVILTVRLEQIAF